MARIGNRTITAEQFKKSLLEKKSGEISYEARLDHLNDMIDNELKLIEAFRHNLENDDEILDDVDEFERGEVYNAVIETQVIEKVISDDLLKKVYYNKGLECKVRHIFLLPGEEKSAMKLLDSLRLRLRRESFEELAREFSRDSLSAGKGGDLGFIQWNYKRFGDSFNDVVYSLRIGEISNPFRSEKGFHLVKVEKTRKVIQPPFDSIRMQLLREQFRQHRDTLQLRYTRFIQRLKETYRTEYVTDNTTLFLSYMAPDSGGGPQTGDPLDRISSEDAQKALIVYDGGEYSIEDLVSYLKRQPPFRRPPLRKAERLKQLLDRNIARELIVAWGYEKGLQHRREIRDKLEQHKHESMIKRIEKVMVIDAAEPDEDACRAYYGEHLDKYASPPRMKVQEIYMSEKTTADRVAREAKGKVDFDRLAASFNERPFTKDKNGDLGYITSSQYGAIGEAASKMREGEIVGPIKVGNAYSVIKLLDKKESELKSYEEAASRIKFDLRRKMQEEKREQWLAKLRSEMAILVYEGNLRNTQLAPVSES